MQHPPQADLREEAAKRKNRGQHYLALIFIGYADALDELAATKQTRGASPRESAATVRALALIERGWTAYRAAKHVGIAMSTIYRALKRRRERGEATQKSR